MRFPVNAVAMVHGTPQTLNLRELLRKCLLFCIKVVNAMVTSVQVVLNNLYKSTALQMRFPVNAVALVDGTPQTLTLKEFLQKFLEFRCEVVRRRARSALHPISMLSPQRKRRTFVTMLVSCEAALQGFSRSGSKALKRRRGPSRLCP